jgi:hypothetical protein
MSSIEFISNLSYLDALLIFGIQLAIFLAHYSFLKKKQMGFLDPFTLVLFFTASSWAIVIFLFANDLCSFKHIRNFLISNLLFVLGYNYVAPNVKWASKSKITKLPDSSIFRYFGFSCAAIFIACLFLNFKLFGFGIIYENRLDIYSDSGGLGFLKRCMDALMPSVIFFYVVQNHIVRNKTANLYNNSLKYAMNGLIIIIAIFAIFDGSKSGIVSILLAFFLSNSWLKARYGISAFKLTKLQILIFIATSSFLAIMILAYQLQAFDSLDGLQSVVQVLLYRIILGGDIYINAYPNNIIDSIAPQFNSFLVLFNDVLSTLKLIHVDIQSLGSALYNQFVPKELYSSGGPNAQLAIYSYYLFGSLGAPIFSLLLGMLYGLIRAGLFLFNSKNYVSGAFFVTLIANLSGFLTDPSYTMHKLTNIFLIALPLVFFFKLISKIKD